MAMRGQVLLTQLDPTDWMGERKGKIERKKKEERERRNSRVRSSHFSLEFPVIGPSNSGETRGKVDPTARTRVGTSLVEFRKLREVGVFFYFDILV